MTGRRRVSYAITLLASALTATPVKAAHPIVSLTEDLVLGVLTADDPGSTTQNDRLSGIAEERANALVANARSHTALLLGTEIPESISSRIDASLLQYVEENIEVEGYLTVSLREHNDLSRAHEIALEPAEGSDRIVLYFDSPMPTLPIGQMVRVRGTLLPTLDEGGGASVRHMVLRSDALTVVSDADALTVPSPEGRQRTGVFLVKLTDDLNPIYSRHDRKSREFRRLARARSFGRSWLSVDKLKRLVRAHSFGRAWLSVEMMEEVRTDTTGACDTNNLRETIIGKINQFGRTIDQFDRIIAFLPDMGCGWRTQASFPGSPTMVFVNEKLHTERVVRALLHSFGMVGDQAFPCDFDTIHSVCQWGERSVPKRLRGRRAVSISAFQKERLGWVDVTNSERITPVETGGSFRIVASDYLRKDRRLALKLLRPAPLLGLETTYYIEYRARRDRDQGGRQVEVVLYILSGGRVADVLNLTSPDLVSVELQDTIEVSVGRFIDHEAGVEIEVVSADPWAADLDISFDPTSCVRVAPGVDIAPAATPYASPGSATQFSVAISNRDSGACPPLTLGLHPRLPEGWSVQQDPSELLLQPNETAVIDMAVTIPPDEVPGFRELEWVVQGGHAPFEVRRSTMLFVLPGGTSEGTTAGPIPASACWKFESETMSSSDIERWNDLAAGWLENQGSGSHRRATIDQDLPYEILTNKLYQPCTVTDAGLISCVRKPGDKDKHTMFEMVGSCPYRPNGGRYLYVGRTYRFGFKMCIPSGADWIRTIGRERWDLIMQIHQAGGLNPPIGIYLRGENTRTDIEVVVRGDTRTLASIRYAGKNYQFYRKKIVGTVDPGNCYTFNGEVVMDPEKGGQGEFVIDINGKKVFDARAEYGDRLQLGYTEDDVVGFGPILGQYGGNHAPVLEELLFDNLWLEVE